MGRKVSTKRRLWTQEKDTRNSCKSIFCKWRKKGWVGGKSGNWGSWQEESHSQPPHFGKSKNGKEARV